MPDLHPAFESEKFLKIFLNRACFFFIMWYTINVLKRQQIFLEHMQLWRNWHTRMIQVHVHVLGYGFKSRQLHFGSRLFRLDFFYCETNPSEWSKKRKLSLSNFWNSINELNGRLMRQLQGLPNQVLLIS